MATTNSLEKDRAPVKTRTERRRELRRTTAGTVKVCFSDPAPTEIEGQLIDVSARGFRMAHDCQWLTTGQIVEFRHVIAGGRARVVWNRIVGRHIETGLVVL